MDKLFTELKTELLELVIKDRNSVNTSEDRVRKDRIHLICDVLDKHRGHNDLALEIRKNNQNTVDVMVSLYLELKKNKIDIPKKIQKDCENIVEADYLKAITKCVLEKLKVK